jgi:ATP-dependent Clp protease ATP-binding subunit ClpA
VLVAIFGEKDSHAVYFLQQQGIARLDVVNYISHGITKTPQAHQGKNDQEAEQEGQAETSNSPLDNYTQNLNALALAGKIDPLDRPRQELERVVQTLCRRRKNNPLLVGEAGRRQDRHRRGPGAAHRRGQRPRPAREVHGLCARHGRAPRRHESTAAISSSA